MINYNISEFSYNLQISFPFISKFIEHLSIEILSTKSIASGT